MKQLLLEGTDDDHVVRNIKKIYAIPEKQFEHIDCMGIDKLLDIYIPRILKGDTVFSVGIVIDADSNIKSRWQSLKDKLIAYGYTLPEAIPADGLILNGDKKIGIWIMPDNNTNGMLEDFISMLIPDGDQLASKANEILDEIETANINKYSKVHRSKAFIHTWLAWQEEPGRPFGQAITNKSLTTEKEISDRFAAWLKRLFDE
jgi:hypothetical protein